MRLNCIVYYSQRRMYRSRMISDDGRWTMDDGRWTMRVAQPSIVYRLSSIVYRPSSIVVSEHGEGGGDRADDPERADKGSQHVSELDDVRREIGDRERAGEGKGPGSPGGDEAQPGEHDGDKHGAKQVADDVDEQVGKHYWIAVEARPKGSQLRRGAGLGDVVGQVV